MVSSPGSVSEEDERPSAPLIEAQKGVLGSKADTAGISSPKEPIPAESHKPDSEAQPNGEDSSSEPSEEGAVEEDAQTIAEKDSSGAPPLPIEPVPEEDDGWQPLWSVEASAWYFFNRFTQQSQWDNPRVPSDGDTAPGTSAASTAPPLPPPFAGGYNPAIHGDYDPNADYAQVYKEEDENITAQPGASSELLHTSGAYFNRATGKFQTGDQGVERHTDDAKSRRQMNAFFDVDAAANAHEGRSLKAERSGKKPSKQELKAFKEKRRAKKEEKRRAWLRD